MTEHKFASLRFRIYEETDKEVKAIVKPLEKYPQIKKIKELDYYLPLIKYLIFLYDPKTDLNLEYVRLEDRIQKAAELSGLDKIKDQIFLDSVYSFQHPETLEAIQVLLTEVYHDTEYREWQTLHKELDELNRARWKPLPDDIKALEKKSLYRKQSQEIIEQIKQYEQAIFGDHEQVKTIAYKSRFISPESFAKAAKVVV